MNPATKPLSTADLAHAGEAEVERPAMAPPHNDDGHASLFRDNDAADLKKRWSDIQGGFVDEPRKAVEEADSLVAQVIKRLSEVFADERTTLEHQWDRGDQISTEDLRIALRKYRSFFDRLLSL